MSPQESDSSQQEPEPKGWTVIRVTLSLPGPTWPVPEGDARTAFWTAVLDRRRRYGVLPPGMDAAPPVAPPTYMIDEEKSIRSKFAAALKNRVEPYLRQIGRRRPSVIERVRRGATATTSASGKATGFDLEIERISYDSLSVILKVCGLEEYAEAADSLLPLITHLFALYAPSALNEALLGPKMPDLGFTAMAQAGLPPGLAAPDQGKADGMVTLWRIAGGSLLLPLLLALGVLFLAFTAVRESGTLLTEQRAAAHKAATDAIWAESRALAKERADLTSHAVAVLLAQLDALAKDKADLAKDRQSHWDGLNGEREQLRNVMLKLVAEVRAQASPLAQVSCCVPAAATPCKPAARPPLRAVDVPPASGAPAPPRPR